MKIVEALTEDLCYMWNIGEETNISHVDKLYRFRSDIFCYVLFTTKT